MSKLNKYHGFFTWAFINGLFLGILIAHGQDISEEGILSMVISELNKAIPVPGYFWLQIGLFLIGLAALAGEVILIIKENTAVKVMVGSTFLSLVFLIIGVAWTVSFLQNFGIFLMLIGIGILIYLKNEH